MPKRTAKTREATEAKDYRHDSEKALLRPEAGAQTTFPPNKQKEPVDYHYDSSLAPALEWDENPARQEGEALIAEILQTDDIETAKAAAEKLKRLGRPFLDWARRAELQNITVPSLPLFVHERLSTKAILDTLEQRKRDRSQTLDLFGESNKSIGEKMGGAYEHSNGWQNRLILGDSLQVMNSLLQYESMGGKVQMVYMDPPYGISFGGNFQPFVRRRGVNDGDDDSFSREPEMVQAYRDTWELGVHSWLTYMRDRLLLAREMLTDSGSCFVQISDENVHLVRSVMDEVFGRENFVSQIAYKVTSGFERSIGPRRVEDYIIWYANRKENCRFHRLYKTKSIEDLDTSLYRYVDEGGRVRVLTPQEKKNPNSIPPNARIFCTLPLHTMGNDKREPRMFDGESYIPPVNTQWRHTAELFNKMLQQNRVMKEGNRIRSKYYLDDFPYEERSTFWNDTGPELNKNYVVQTSSKVIQRCMLMTTNPGDLVFDPTCGGGTTAVVAEEWGRRWITADVSRVPLVLTRQRLLTATYPYYELQDKKTGPVAGFQFTRRKNTRGEEVGGIVPRITLRSIANNEPPTEVVMVDRPEKRNNTIRVTGPFCVEAVIPTPLTTPEKREGGSTRDDKHYPRMLEVLRLSPQIRLSENKYLTVKNVSPPAKAFSLHAEAQLSGNNDGGEDESVAVIFGPANGAISEKVVLEAAKEAKQKEYKRLLVIAFAIEPPARKTVADCENLVGIPALYVQASTDLTMSDLLKNMRASEVFAVCGMPEIELKLSGEKNKDGEELYQATLLGLDVFDPVTREAKNAPGDDVPCWMLDTDYDGYCFRAGQVFFPKTSAWDKLKRALGAEWDDSVWSHLSGTISKPFVVGENKQVAVKVIDERGNELMVVKRITEIN